jgi:hypothetical protein
MQASAPRATRALTCAEQMLPLPPVQNTTFSEKRSSFQTDDTYLCFETGMIGPVASVHSKDVDKELTIP